MQIGTIGETTNELGTMLSIGYATKIATILMLLVLTSCIFPLLTTPDLRAGKNFDNRTDDTFKLLFSIGDEFITLREMFVFRTTENNLRITRPGLDSPDVESYLANPKASPYRVVKMLPRGTRIRIVGLKDSFNVGYLPYFNIENDPTWVSVAEFSVPDTGGPRRWSVDYNHDLFKRVKRGLD